MSDKALLTRFDAWRSEGRTLVLATVVGTAGSTYTKAGQRMLIADSGDYQGLVSGGCLEGDLAAHATHVHLHNSLTNAIATSAIATEPALKSA